MKQILTIAALLFTSITAVADEGMWMMGNLSARTDSVMQSLGLNLTHKQVFNPYAPSLNDAVVSFGGYCSGVVVSPEGLVFTNHHCGFRSIQANSSTKHDYLKYGFCAKTMADELPNEDLYVDFHLNTIDVTDRVLAGITDTTSLETRSRLIGIAANEIEEENYDPDHNIYGEVSAYYNGSKFYLSIYQRYEDVRLVFAPPQSLGKFGGDTDNWMWPRQTCDFSVFRIYAGRDNQPAEYSKDNRPYSPKSYAHVSVSGYQPGTYCMTIGFPGSTERYLSSYGIEQTMRAVNDVRYEVRGVKLDVLKDAMRADDAIRIKYASKYASTSNYWKNALGQNTALENLGVVKEKQALEAEINEWVNAQLSTDNDIHSGINVAPYVGLLDSLKLHYAETFDTEYIYRLYMESFYNGNDILSFAMKSFIRKQADDEAAAIRSAIEKTYKDIDIDLDRQVFVALAKNFRKMLKPDMVAEWLPDFYHEVDSAYGGDVEAYANHLYQTSCLCQSDRLNALSSYDEIKADPMYDVAMDIYSRLLSLVRKGSAVGELERRLGDALRLMNHDKEYYPDANSTMRLSFGSITPLNGNYQTMPQSLIDKNESTPSNYDYELLPEVQKWLKRGKFGERYVDALSGQMPLCFLSNNDITGGNSGSGMFDGNGHLIGLAFDGNWEAMSGDFKFDNSLQRCIGVDIRYVLSVIDTYGKGKRLIKELTLE